MNRLVYAVLGASGSGRRALIASLVGEEELAGATVLISDSETPAGEDVRLGAGRWTWADGAISGRPAEGQGPVIWIADGRRNPVDQMEALKPWMAGEGLTLARVFTVIDCQLGAQHPEVGAWHDACVHFSDVVFLAKRDGVPNKWISDCLRRYKEECLPCLFELVRKGPVANPGVLLYPEARRVSPYFDPSDWDGLEGVEIGEGEDDEPGEPPDEDEEEGPPVDPYLERRPGGRRVKEIPDIRRFLDDVT